MGRSRSPIAAAALCVTLAVVLAGFVTACSPVTSRLELLNVSYDPTREFYSDYNALFEQRWKAETGETPHVNMSHGGSGKQARAVVDGLDADVVTLALEPDIDRIAKGSGKIPANWRERLPNGSAPFTSTIVFLVRAGNPDGITDWDDLARPGVQVVTPNPKTSGGARWNYLAAWGWALRAYAGDEPKAEAYMRALFGNVPVLDTGARGATTTFAQRNIGDVLLTWENEAMLALDEFGTERFEIVYPSISILAEPPVSLVDANVDRKGARVLAEAYLQGLYEADAQILAAHHFYRPSRPDVVPAEALAGFPQIERLSIDEAFGGWTAAQAKHFDEGGLFDRIFEVKR